MFHTGAARETQLRWYDRSGSSLDAVGPETSGLWTPILSPDETKVAYVSVGDGDAKIARLFRRMAEDARPMSVSVSLQSE